MANASIKSAFERMWQHNVAALDNKSDINHVHSGYAKIENIPTKTSELTNDSGFLTQHQSLEGLATEEWVEEKFEEHSGFVSDGSAYIIPDYWQTAVDNAVLKVKALQDNGGRDTVNFLLFSDMHYGDNTTKIQHLGHLCAALMDKCNIPLVINCGDTMSSSPLTSETALLTNLDNGTNLLSPIPREGYAQIYGNHDDVWGNNNGVSYVNKVAPKKMWNRVFRKQTEDLRRVFGGNGTYFYIDNVHQKVRFICLNSHYYNGAEITNGTTKIMTTGFGAEQLEWLRDTALNVENDWSVVIATHVPPTEKTINGKTYYLSQISDGASFRSIIEETTAKLIGVFCGHCHASAIVTNDLPCPIVTVTTAGGSPYDSNEGTRTAGTATETAIDVVSINKAEERIYLTRLGIGSDRTCSYSGVEIITYNVTNKLTNVVSNNAAVVAESGKPYVATLTANSGYKLSAVTVTMGGTDVTSSVYSNGSINIESVTGDIIITAATIKQYLASTYTNLAAPSSSDWLTDQRLNSSGDGTACEGAVVTNFIPITTGDVIRVVGIDFNKYANYSSAPKNGIFSDTATISTSTAAGSDIHWTYSTENNGEIAVFTITAGDAAKRFRMSGDLAIGYTVDDIIITKNDKIGLYDVTTVLNNTTINNTNTGVEHGKQYNATLTPFDGYELSTVNVTMGGTDVTSTAYSNGIINIASVTGDIIITATATENAIVPTYTNLADPTSSDWLTDQRLNSSGGGTACVGAVVTNFIPITTGDVIRVKGIDFTDYANYSSAPKNGVFTDTTAISSSVATGVNNYWTYSTENNGEIAVFTITASSNTTRFRLSGDLIGTAEDVIITKNEQIA